MERRLAIGIVLALVAAASGWIYAATDSDDVAPILRANAIELVDEHGQVRAQLNVVDDGVVLRLRDADGTIRVKLEGSQAGSGLLLLDESTEPGVHMLAQSQSTIMVREGGELRSVR